MIVAGTGHRPNKLGGYSKRVFTKLTHFAIEQLGQIEGVERVISGMALGWDMALAIGAIDRRIPLTCALPFKGQETRWAADYQDLYRKILEQADEVVVVSEGEYEPYKMFARDKWMVDRCDLLLALYNGTPGGTDRTISYALEVGKPIRNVARYWSP